MKYSFAYKNNTITITTTKVLENRITPKAYGELTDKEIEERIDLIQAFIEAIFKNIKMVLIIDPDFDDRVNIRRNFEDIDEAIELLEEIIEEHRDTGDYWK